MENVTHQPDGAIADLEISRTRVFETLQVELPVRSFFEASTVAGLANLIETIQENREQGEL